MKCRRIGHLARWGVVGMASVGFLACSTPRQQSHSSENAARQQGAPNSQQMAGQAFAAPQAEQGQVIGQEVSVPGETKIETSKNVTETHQIPTVEQKTVKADINRMSVQDFEALGMNSDSAQKVVQFRQQVGSFHSVDELKDVPGIDLGWFDRLSNRLAVG